MPGEANDPDDPHSYRIRLQHLNQNPAIAAYYFQKRWDIFFHGFVKPKWNVTDYWWRYEWQHRGSSHIHGFLWMKNAPSVDTLDLSDALAVQNWLDYWDNHISTWNPGINVPPADIHPSSRLFNTLSDTKQELAEILNRLQRHTKCQPGYCQRKKKDTQEVICRFGFPKLCRETSAYTKVPGRDIAEHHTARNDQLLNSYNASFILAWRANIDIRPIINREAVIAYASKYASKGETVSSGHQHALHSAIARLEGEAPARAAYQKTLSTFVAERDISAQETCHLLLNCKLVCSSRTFRSLNVDPDYQSHWVNFQTSNVERHGILEHYIKRPSDPEHAAYNISLLEFATHWNWRGNSVHRHGARGAPPYVVSIYPCYCPDPEDDDFEKYCYARMILHHPFHSLDILKGGYQTWIAAYKHLCLGHNHIHLDDTLPRSTDNDAEVDDSDTESITEENDEAQETYVAEWMREAGRAPNNVMEAIISALGRREIDEQYTSGKPENL
ncbi:hypothetical protein ONZ45_g16931 [Pleurotus djamor]|nr:hypothetical protein ONZ45_g16931 [Pleurotus djamor]